MDASTTSRYCRRGNSKIQPTIKIYPEARGADPIRVRSGGACTGWILPKLRRFEERRPWNVPDGKGETQSPRTSNCDEQFRRLPSGRRIRSPRCPNRRTIRRNRSPVQYPSARATYCSNGRPSSDSSAKAAEKGRQATANGSYSVDWQYRYSKVGVEFLRKRESGPLSLCSIARDRPESIVPAWRFSSGPQ